jgi:hypothetical protein
LSTQEHQPEPESSPSESIAFDSDEFFAALREPEPKIELTEALSNEEFFEALKKGSVMREQKHQQSSLSEWRSMSNEEFHIALVNAVAGLNALAQEPEVKAVASPEPLPKPKHQPKPEHEPKYPIGTSVKTRFTPEPLTVVDATIYSPSAQRYMLSHHDPQWVPPKECTVNTNYGSPRICVHLSDIEGSNA